MSEGLLSRRNQPLLAWLMLLLVVLSGIFFVVLPVVTKSMELSEQIDSGYRHLSKMRGIKQATPEFVAEYKRVQAQGLDKLFYPEGMTAAQVGKELQKQLADVIRQRKGVLVSSEVIDDPDTADDEQVKKGYRRVTVQADFNGDTSLLREVLHQAYRSRPLMFVDRLEVKPQRDDGGQNLKGTVRISTYWRGGEDNNETIN
jgi:hypothetical protein